VEKDQALITIFTLWHKHLFSSWVRTHKGKPKLIKILKIASRAVANFINCGHKDIWHQLLFKCLPEFFSSVVGPRPQLSSCELKKRSAGKPQSRGNNFYGREKGERQAPRSRNGKQRAVKSIFPKQWLATRRSGISVGLPFPGPTHLERQRRLLTRLLSFCGGTEAVRKIRKGPSWRFFFFLYRSLKSANWSGFRSGVKLI